MRSHLPAIAVILTAVSGCDNVAWGGVEVSVERPGVEAADRAGEESDVEAPPPRPTGPILLSARRDGVRLRLEPVGELLPAGLVPLPQPEDTAAYAALRSRRLATGTEWILFAEGVRVGSATVTDTVEAPELCGPWPALEATPELLPSATDAARFLALPAADADRWGYEEYRPLTHNYDQRVASLTLGAAALPRVGAPWPPDGMLPNRRDIRAFRLLEATNPTIAASFVVGDELDTSRAAPTSYALFLLADERVDGFTETFVWYRPGSDAKAAPRFFERLDWDRDGQSEILLEVYGEGRRGYLALERGTDADPERWTEVFHTPCAHLGPPAATARD